MTGTRSWMGAVVVVAVWLFGVGGCASPEPITIKIGGSNVTPGKDGRLEAQSSRCLDCALIPFMAGGERRISVKVVNEEKDATLLAKESNPRFESSDAAIFTTEIALNVVVNRQGRDIHSVNLNVHGLSAGTAELRVLDGAGAVVDRVGIEVRNANHVAFGDKDQKPITEAAISRATKSMKVTGVAYDGDTLLDTDEGFAFTSANAAIVTVIASCTTFICFGDTANNVVLAPQADGSTTLKLATASGVSATIPVTVTP